MDLISDLDYFREEANILANEIQKEIDFEIISNLLVEYGWTKVVVRRVFSMKESHEIDLWVTKNCKHQVRNHGLVWVFEDQQDANWFTLRWM